MEFCQKCGIRLFVPTQSAAITCAKCGFTKEPGLIQTNYRVYRKANREGVIVVDQAEAALCALAATRAVCPRCAHGKAYFRLAEVGDDESTNQVQIFRCTRCGYTWREKG